jgi:hypothetical protein
VPAIAVRVWVRSAWSGSSNTSTAVSNDRPCLRRFAAALSGSHVRRTALVVVTNTELQARGVKISVCVAGASGASAPVFSVLICVANNRRPAPHWRLKRVPGLNIIAPRRSNSAHLRRPWRATYVRARYGPRESPFLRCRSIIRPPPGRSAGLAGPPADRARPRRRDLGRR